MNFIINNQGQYQTISSVHSVNTRNVLHMQDNLLTSQSQLPALYILLHNTYIISAESVAICVFQIFRLSIRDIS
jgi:hypothetical protein